MARMGVPPEWRWLYDRAYAWGYRLSTSRFAKLVIIPPVAIAVIACTPRLRQAALKRFRRSTDL